MQYGVYWSAAQGARLSRSCNSICTRRRESHHVAFRTFRSCVLWSVHVYADIDIDAADAMSCLSLSLSLSFCHCRSVVDVRLWNLCRNCIRVWSPESCLPRRVSFLTAQFFTALHGMQTRSCDEISVCPSVCPSVRPSVRLSNACIVTKRKKNLSRFLYHAKDHSV